jgi:hypothetical protein
VQPLGEEGEHFLQLGGRQAMHLSEKKKLLLLSFYKIK